MNKADIAIHLSHSMREWNANDDDNENSTDDILVAAEGVKSEKGTMDIEGYGKNPNKNAWMSSGSKWRDYLHFCGPGWLVAIAYLDPGNTQADIQAGAVGGYSQLWTFFWVTTLSIYVQVLCARLSMVGQTTLSESMRKIIKHRWLRYVAWAIAEFSVIITDIPEVIGMGIAFNVFFGWPYYVGCLISPVTTLLFLATQNSKGGMRWLEGVIVLLIGVMAVTIFIEWGLVDSDPAKAIEGLVYGFVEPEGRNLWLITGIIGAVVMPHNLYLHTASVLSRPVKRDNETIKKATFWVSVEPIVPIMFSFLINIGIVIVAAENVNGKCIPVGGESEEDCENNIGNTDFAKYLTVGGGSILWGIALLAAGQSSAITTTYSGQYIMDGFLEMRIPVWARAIGTRMIALLPCVLIAACVPGDAALNTIVNIVNSSLAILLPFALTPLARLVTSKAYFGEYAAKKWEAALIWFGAFAVYAINVLSLTANGAGFFGGLMAGVQQTLADGTTVQVQTAATVQFNILNDVCQVIMFAYMVYFVFIPIDEPMRNPNDPRPVEEEGCFGVVKTLSKSDDAVESESFIGDSELKVLERTQIHELKLLEMTQAHELKLQTLATSNDVPTVDAGQD